MTIGHDTCLREIAFTVCTELDAVGICAVLTGGSAATVYSNETYLSRDLDFVIQFDSGDSKPAEVLARLGYEAAGSLYTHSQSPFTLDFPPGPLAVGRDLVDRWNTLREGERLLHILFPTDCCRDRLAGFLFWNDRGSLEQAVAVATQQRAQIDLNAIETWCVSEGLAEKYREFLRALEISRS
jgi:hypothetical protein